jgi:hypothetical protein
MYRFRKQDHPKRGCGAFGLRLWFGGSGTVMKALVPGEEHIHHDITTSYDCCPVKRYDIGIYKYDKYI